MASITLRLKSHHRKPSSNVTFSLLFSSSSTSNNKNGEKPYLTKIKSELKQQQPPSFNDVFTPSKLGPFDEIRKKLSESRRQSEILKKLSEFRRLSSVSTPESPTFQRNVGNPNTNPNPNIVAQNPFAEIRARLRNLNATVDEEGKSVNEQIKFHEIRAMLRNSNATIGEKGKSVNEPNKFHEIRARLRNSNATVGEEGKSVNEPNKSDEIRAMSRNSNATVGEKGKSVNEQNKFHEIRARLRNLNATVGEEGKSVNEPNKSDEIRAMLRNSYATVGEKGKSVNEPNKLDERLRNIRQNLLKLRATMEKKQQHYGDCPLVTGGWVENLPANVSGREMEEEETKKKTDGMELMAVYTKDKLGKLLRELRPEGIGKKSEKDDWFSLSELGERLKELKDIEMSKMVMPESRADFLMMRRSFRNPDANSRKVKYQILFVSDKYLDEYY